LAALTVCGRSLSVRSRFLILRRHRIGPETLAPHFGRRALEYECRALAAKLVHQDGDGLPDDTPNLASVTHAAERNEDCITFRPALPVL